MSGIDNIKANILKDADARADEIVAQALQQKSEIIQRMVSDAEAEAGTSVADAQKHAFELINRANSVSGLEGRKKLLAAKREIISEVFDRIELNFSRMEPEEYTKLLASMARSAGKNGGTLVFSECDKQYARGVYSMLDGSRFSLSKEYTGDIPNGFILCSGDVYIECSVRSAIEEHRRELESEISNILFADGVKQEG